MTPFDSRVPPDERPKVRRALADLEAAHIAGARPDLAALAPPGPWRVPYLLALIPFDMRYLYHKGEPAAAAVEAYLAAFPDLRRDPDAVALLVHEEHAARAEGGPPAGGAGEATGFDPRARFAYEARFPDLWPRLFPYADTTRLPEPGERVGDWYRVDRPIGRGGMGVVLACRDERLKRWVAIKVLAPDAPRSSEARFRERFRREAEALARVDDPNVVRVYAAGLAGPAGREAPYFVMEYIDGETFDGRLRAGPLPPPEVVRVGRGVAAGLRAIHAAGLVHRDVTPRNVMLRATGEPVLLDLGLVRSDDAAPPLTAAGAVMGTVAFMAPEQADGKEVDPRADLFSFGCVLYRAATGVMPFTGDQITALLMQIRCVHPPPAAALVPALPAGLSDLIGRMMAKAPADRPPSAAAVLAELDAIAAGAGRDAPRPRRRRYWAGGALAGAVVLGGVLSRGCGDTGADPRPPAETTPPVAPARPEGPVAYRGKADAVVHRNGRWVPLIDPAALPLKTDAHFKVTLDIDPPAYLYVFWVEPDGKTDPLYPWAGAWGTRPKAEKRVTRLSLPEGGDYTPDPERPSNGVITVVAVASPDPLPLADGAIEGWFAGLPAVTRPTDDTRAVVWFDDFARPRLDPTRAPKVVGSIDPYERWQAALKERIGGAVAYQMSVSFAQAAGP